ncbi:hypothetical protein D3C81_1299030 [compost metagenome]
MAQVQVAHQQQRQRAQQVPVDEAAEQFEQVAPRKIEYPWLCQQAAEGWQPGVLVEQRDADRHCHQLPCNTQPLARHRDQQKRGEQQVRQRLEVEQTQGDQ